MSGLPVVLALLSWFWMTAACGGDPSMPPEDGPVERRPVTGTVQNSPALLLYREAAETTWQPVTMTTPTRFEFHPRGPYLLTMVCKISSARGTFPEYFFVQQIGRTPEDPRELPTWCWTEGPHLVSVDFIANQKVNRVMLGAAIGQYEPAYPYSNYSFQLPAGTFDLLAISQPTSSNFSDRIMIRRDLQITGPGKLPNRIDFSAEAKSTVESYLTHVNPEPTEKLFYIEVKIETPHGQIWVFRSSYNPPYRAMLAPNSVLEPSDVQTLMVVTKSGEALRGIRRRLREGDSTAFTLPEFFNGFMLSTVDGKPVTTWTPLPDHTQLYNWLTGYSANFEAGLSYQIIYSRSFEEAVGMTSITPETDIPGFQPAWRFDVTKYYGQEMYVERTDGNDTLFSGAFINMNVGNFPTIATGTASDPLAAFPMPAGSPSAH
jgi:hypothetical protein